MDIDSSAFGPVRAFLAEYVVAAWRETQGGSPLLLGGRRRGHDVSDADLLIDAKVLVPLSASERRTWPGCEWKVARDRHVLFNPITTTHIALVALPDDMGLTVTSDDGAVTINATTKGAQIFVVEVDEFNDQLDPDNPDAEGWRYLILETEWLERHRVQ
jgi:hypothetical protein